jgi:hypothetical protein
VSTEWETGRGVVHGLRGRKVRQTGDLVELESTLVLIYMHWALADKAGTGVGLAHAGVAKWERDVERHASDAKPMSNLI